MTYVTRLALAQIVICLLGGALVAEAADVADCPWAVALLRPGEYVSDISSAPPVRFSGRDSVHAAMETATKGWYTLTAQSLVDSLVGRTLRVAVANGVAHVDSEFSWLISQFAGERGRINIADPITVDQGRWAVNLVAPSLEPGEVITWVGPAESVEVENGEVVSVLLPNTIDVFTSHGVMKGGRVMSVESVGDSARVYERGVISH